ncbi:MAG: hypothetical protein LUC43_05515, partial [Burkholderiales bacterium]|nr:hypothetical protein [Burkholderiales bacterium]
MEAKIKTFAKTFFATSLIACLGFGTASVLADQVPGYCGVILCSSGEAASFLKQQLELGDAKLGWWDCRIQGKCQDLEEEIKKLSMDEKGCTLDKLASYRKDIAALDTKLGELVSKFGEKGREAVGYKMRDGLTGDLMNHYKQCYKEGFFKPDPNTCVTADCAALVTEIEKLEVNQDNCKGQLRILSQQMNNNVWDFDYEQKIIGGKLDAYKNECVQANLIPALEVFGMPIFQKDIVIGQQCESMGRKLAEETNNFQENEQACQSDHYDALHNQVKELSEALAKLGQAIGEPNSSWRTNIIDDFKWKITQHFAKCENQNLFPTEKTRCLSQECKDVVAQIENYQVNKENCENNPNKTRIKTPFKFEEEIEKTTLSNYRIKCMDANIIPAAKAYGMPIFNKDLPLANQCQSLEDKLDSYVKGFKMSAESCSLELFNTLNKDFSDFGDLLEKLAKVSPNPPRFNDWTNQYTRKFDRDIIQHFVACEKEGLFPSDKSKCLSQRCMDDKAEIEALVVNENNCKHKSSPSSIQTIFKFEEGVLRNAYTVYRTKCIDANLLPAGKIFDHPVLKKDLPLAQSIEATGDKLNSELLSISKKVNASTCTTEKYKELDALLVKYGDELDKLAAAMGVNSQVYWLAVPYTKPKNALHDHFRECARQKLFP